MEDFEEFFRIEKYVKELREREETRRAVSRMLELIARACVYVRDKTKSGYFSKGTMFFDYNLSLVLP